MVVKFVEDSVPSGRFAVVAYSTIFLAAFDYEIGVSVLDLLEGIGVYDLTLGLESRTCKRFLRDN